MSPSVVTVARSPPVHSLVGVNRCGLFYQRHRQRWYEWAGIGAERLRGWSTNEMTREVLIRLSGFVPVFGLMASWELLAPRRRVATSKATRWLANLSLVGLNTLVVRWLFTAGAVGAASMATLPFMAAKTAKEQGHDVVLWLWNEAVMLARKGTADHVVGASLTSLKDLLAAV